MARSINDEDDSMFKTFALKGEFQKKVRFPKDGLNKVYPLPAYAPGNLAPTSYVPYRDLRVTHKAAHTSWMVPIDLYSNWGAKIGFIAPSSHGPEALSKIDLLEIAFKYAEQSPIEFQKLLGYDENGEKPKTKDWFKKSLISPKRKLLMFNHVNANPTYAEDSGKTLIMQVSKGAMFPLNKMLNKFLDAWGDITNPNGAVCLHLRKEAPTQGGMPLWIIDPQMGGPGSDDPRRQFTMDQMGARVDLENCMENYTTSEYREMILENLPEMHSFFRRAWAGHIPMPAVQGAALEQAPPQPIQPAQAAPAQAVFVQTPVSTPPAAETAPWDPAPQQTQQAPASQQPLFGAPDPAFGAPAQTAMPAQTQTFQAPPKQAAFAPEPAFAPPPAFAPQQTSGIFAPPEQAMPTTSGVTSQGSAAVNASDVDSILGALGQAPRA